MRSRKHAQFTKQQTTVNTPSILLESLTESFKIKLTLEASYMK
jgi:hypothetical protein